MNRLTCVSGKRSSKLAIAAGIAAAAAMSAASYGQVVISNDFAPVGSTLGGFIDYAQGPGYMSQVNVNGDNKLQYVNANGQYWGQFLCQSWANSAILLPTVQANSTLEFDLDFSQVNWGQLNFKVDYQTYGGSSGDQNGSEVSQDLHPLLVPYHGSNPLVEHMSISLAGTDLVNRDVDATGSNLTIYLQPGYYGFWDGAWEDQYITQTFTMDNFRLVAGPAKTNAAWTGNSGGNWSDSGQWGNSTVPNGVGHTANFMPYGGDGNTTAAQTVTVDAPVQLSVLNFNSANTVTIDGSSTLTLAGTDGVDAAINVVQGSHVITAPLTISSDVAVSIKTGASLSVSNIASSSAINVSGGGTLHADSLTASALNVNAGVVSLHTDSLPRGSAPLVSVVNTVTIANDGGALGSRVYSASIDVGTSDMIIHGGDVADVTEMARAGQNGATLFAGNGLTSSAAAADANGQLRYAVGVIQNDFEGGAIYDTFDGVAVTDSDILVKFTYFGDADLSGSIDDTDFFLINNGFANHLTGWVNGDFDYSGAVDDTDFFLINNAFALQGSGLRAGGAVPEPTGMGVLALASGVLLGRRRK